jgi:predicted metalloendopeptidase
MRILTLSLAAAMALTPVAALAADGPGAVGSPKGAKPEATKGFDKANLDTSCKPCDDFNKYANGGWIAKNPVPPEYPTWGTFSALRDRNLDALKTILEESAAKKAAKGTSEQKIGDYFFSAMDTKTRDEVGVKPLEPMFARIDAVKSPDDLQNVIAYFQTYNVDPVFGIGALSDFKNSERVIAIVGQGGLGLPERDYYVNDDERSKEIRERYVAHVARILELGGASAADAAAQAKAVMAIETRLANASITNVELRDPNNSYNILTVAERKELTPHFDWDRYLKNVGQSSSTTLNVAHPKFFKEFDAMLGSVSLDDWKAYLRWRVLDSFAAALSTPFVDENFEFNAKFLAGTEQQQPLWKRSVAATSGSLGELVGEVYVARYFPPESKRRMVELVDNLKAALRDNISTADWMSDETRKQALAKLENFRTKIGYPDKWKDYSKLEVDRGPFVANAVRVQRWAFEDQMRKAGKPLDRSEWGMTPQTVNASFNPFRNDLTFPAGILQPPFFNPDADDAINYGAIGAVIGHEITHGFDDSGARFDANGNLRNWWTEKDLENFQARAKCVVDQFDGYTIADGTHLKGKLVSGESIADLGGLKIAWAAYHKSLEGKSEPAPIDGFTHEQRFFLGYAQVWAATHKPQFEQLQTNTDPHPLPRFRLNGTLSNMPEFHKAFGCKAGDPMVRAAQCVIW